MSNYIKFEERTGERKDQKTNKRVPTYKPVFIPKGTFPVITEGKKGHSILMVPGVNYYTEVKGSPDAIQTKIDLENEVPKEKKSTSSSKK